MPPRRSTRSAPKSDSVDSSSAAVEKKCELKKSATPAIVLIHPKTSGYQEIITLPHPQTSKPTRYLLTDTAICEITAFQNPKTDPQSWLLVPKAEGTDLGTGETVSSGTAYVATPVDPLFLMLSTFFPGKEEKGNKLFIPVDELTEKLYEGSPHWRRVLHRETPRMKVERRLQDVSDSVDAGGEKMYRPNEDKLMKVLVQRVERMAEHLKTKGGSLVKEFVDKPLIPPNVLSSTNANVEKAPTGDNKDSESAAGETTKENKPPAEGDEKENKDSIDTASFKALQCLLTAHNYLTQTLLPPHISASLLTALESAHDFTPLQTHLQNLKSLRAQLSAARSADFGLKRGYEGGDEEALAREEKRRKKVEEEEAEKKKRKNMSKALKDLEKVDTKGMKKLSSFFVKKS